MVVSPRQLMSTRGAFAPPQRTPRRSVHDLVVSHRIRYPLGCLGQARPFANRSLAKSVNQVCRQRAKFKQMGRYDSSLAGDAHQHLKSKQLGRRQHDSHWMGAAASESILPTPAPEYPVTAAIVAARQTPASNLPLVPYQWYAPNTAVHPVPVFRMLDPVLAHATRSQGLRRGLDVAPITALYRSCAFPVHHQSVVVAQAVP